MSLLRRDKAKTLEATVQDLEIRRAGVLRRLEAATAKAEQATAEQRMFLTTTDGADARQAKALAEACRRTADERAALEDAARALADEIADAQASLAADRDRRERDRAAKEVEAGAARIEAAAAELSRAAAAFDIAREALVSACRDHAPKDILGNDCRQPIVTAAARQAGILPRETEQYWVTLHLDAVPAAAEHVTAMRANARAIREGAASVARPAPVPECPRPAVFPEVMTVLSRAAFYRNYLGQRIDLPQAGGFSVPEPIAAQADRLGLGFGPETVPGKAILSIVSAQPSARIEPDGQGSFRAVRTTGVLGDGGRGIPPAPPPADLGGLPDFHGVILAEAAQ